MEQQPVMHAPPVFGSKLIVGFAVVALGILMAGDNLRFWNSGEYLRYWPLLLIAIGLFKLVEPEHRFASVVPERQLEGVAGVSLGAFDPRTQHGYTVTDAYGGAALTIGGTLLLSLTLGWLRFRFFDLWPLLLIGAGAVMVARSLGYRLNLSNAGGERQVWAVLSHRKIENSSTDFSGARITAFLGGCDIDLTRASIASGPAVIQALAIWGGIDIFVPEGWEIVGELVPIMGALEITARSPAQPEHQLIVRGLALMGGVGVRRRTS
jgi:hypothetical protein